MRTTMRCRLIPSPSASPSPSPSPSPAPLPLPPEILLPPLLTTTAILSSIALTLLIINYVLRTLRPASVDEPQLPPLPPPTVLPPAVADAGKKTVGVGSIPALDFAKEEKLRRLSHGECSICHSALEEGQRCVSCSASGGFSFASDGFSAVDRWWRRLRHLWLHRRRAGTS